MNKIIFKITNYLKIYKYIYKVIMDMLSFESYKSYYSQCYILLAIIAIGLFINGVVSTSPMVKNASLVGILIVFTYPWIDSFMGEKATGERGETETGEP